MLGLKKRCYLMSYVDMNKANGEDMWFDSGCSNHMCEKKEYFSDFDGSFGDSEVGNNSSMVVMGKGNIWLQVNRRLKNNLLSIGQLQEKGLNILFQGKKCKVFHPEKGLIMETKMALNRMFILHAISQPIASACFNTITEDMVQLWHCRYGHLSFKDLKTLQQKKMVNGLPQLKSPSRLCKACLVGKQQRFSFPRKSTWRASQILQLVHADICGPIKPISNGKKSKKQDSEEAWSGVKPSVEHFRVFGCISHLDDKSLSCVLLGVSEESKAYRLYDPVSQRIITSRDVVFEEDKNWDWGKKYEESIVSELEWGDLEEEATMFDDNEEENEVDPNEEGANLNMILELMHFEEDNEAHLAHLAMFATIDPIHFEDLVKSEKWRKAMDLEMEAIKTMVGVKWIYKTKFNENGEVDKYKAMLVAKGILKTWGRLSEVFTPVAHMETIRLVAALAAQKGWTIYQLDVKSAVLHGELNEVVFVEQPCGYVQKGNEQKVSWLKKTLYGLKQAPRAWYNRIEAYFMKKALRSVTMSILYSSRQAKRQSINCKYFLGLEVLQRFDGVLKRFGMDKSNFVHNPIVPGFKLMKDEGGVKVDKTYYKQLWVVSCI
ncbi:hypothetical protein AAG906_035477 [Vitis piasezkii]